LPKSSITIVGLLFAITAATQDAGQYSFAHYTTASGLLSNQVNTIVQDDEGYIWAGTTDGLQRYDGVRYKVFRRTEKDSSSIPSNPVWQLLIDKKKNLWVLLADGRVGIFNTKKFTFREVPVHFEKPVSPNTAVKRLITDEYGHMFYLMGGSEVITLDEKGDEFSYTHNFFKQKEQWGIADFQQQPGTQKYWMSIEGGGIAVYNKATGQLSYAGNNIEKESAIEQYKALGTLYHFYFDRKQRLWFIEWGIRPFPHIYCYDVKINKPVVEKAALISSLKTYHEIRGFFQQRDGTVWIKGLLVFAKFSETEKKFQIVYNGYRNERSIAYETVHCLYEDREKNVWVATDNNGLYRFNPSLEFFSNISHINRMTGIKGEGGTMCFMFTNRGTVLAGNWGDGVYQYDKGFNVISANIKGFDNNGGPSIWSMFASRDGNTIWMSSQPGIYAVDQKNSTAKFYNPAVLENKTIRQIAEDKNGNLWLGMHSTGVYKWTAAKGKNKFDEGMAAVTAVPRVQVNKITIDSKGYVWIATPETGAYVIDPVSDKVIMHFSDTADGEKKLPERGVSSVLEYDDSTMIITTATRIFRYNRLLKQSSVIGSKEMISGFITAVEKDNHGYLWLTSTAGLYRINIQKRIFVVFTRADGLDNEHFTQSASYTLPDGRILFGTTNSIIVFDPPAVHVNAKSPDLKVTDFKVMNKSLVLDSLKNLKEIELAYRENSLVIEFSPFLYNGASMIKYKLEGLDKEWRIAGRNNDAVYSYLPPGRYTFLLKTIDEEGNESAAKKELTIKINAPFWKTWWFYSLIAMAIGAVFFWFDKERTKRKEAVLKMRSDIADDLHKEINTVLGNINILSEIAKLKANTEPGKSIEFIEQIHDKSQSMMIAMDDMLWSIDPHNDSMENFMLRFKEYIDALRNRHGVQIDLLIDKKAEALQLNMKLSKDVFWFFKNGITNVVKTGANNCRIHISFVNPHLIYTLEFDNTNTDTQQFDNLLQRKELTNKLAAIKAKLDLQTHKTISVFVLSIPVV
jgi:ligand-binding sensor domain-containing protein/signal transduction histidine kinase